MFKQGVSARNAFHMPCSEVMCLGNCHAGSALWVGVQVNLFYRTTMCSTVADKVAKVFDSNLALASDLESILTTCSKLLDGALEADAKVISGKAQHLTNGA